MTVKEVARINQEGTKQCQVVKLADVTGHVECLEKKVEGSTTLQSEILSEIRLLREGK